MTPRPARRPRDTTAVIRSAIRKNRGRIVAFLRTLVESNSHTLNRNGVEAVARAVAREMPDGFAHQVVEVGSGFASHHVFTRTAGRRKPVILADHMDTLCPPESPFQRLTQRGDRLIGPGINDMKGGLTVIIWALRTLEECGFLEGIPVRCIFNSDEESGSPSSRDLFLCQKGRACAAMVYEGGGLKGGGRHPPYRYCLLPSEYPGCIRTRGVVPWTQEKRDTGSRPPGRRTGIPE